MHFARKYVYHKCGQNPNAKAFEREQRVASPKTSKRRFWTRRNRPKQGVGRVEACADDRKRLCDGGGQCLENLQSRVSANAQNPLLRLMILPFRHCKISVYLKLFLKNSQI